MQLPNENATTEELRRFALGLSSSHRMRLAAALFYLEVTARTGGVDHLRAVPGLLGGEPSAASDEIVEDAQ